MSASATASAGIGIGAASLAESSIADRLSASTVSACTSGTRSSGVSSALSGAAGASSRHGRASRHQSVGTCSSAATGAGSSGTATTSGSKTNGAGSAVVVGASSAGVSGVARSADASRSLHSGVSGRSPPGIDDHRTSGSTRGADTVSGVSGRSRTAATSSAGATAATSSANCRSRATLSSSRVSSAAGASRAGSASGTGAVTAASASALATGTHTSVRAAAVTVVPPSSSASRRSSASMSMSSPAPAPALGRLSTGSAGVSTRATGEDVMRGTSATVRAEAASGDSAGAAGGAAGVAARRPRTADIRPLTRAGAMIMEVARVETKASNAVCASLRVANARRLSTGTRRSSQATRSGAMAATGERASLSWASGSRPRNRCGYSSSSMGRPSMAASASSPSCARSVRMSKRICPAVGGVAMRQSRHSWCRGRLRRSSAADSACSTTTTRPVSVRTRRSGARAPCVTLRESCRMTSAPTTSRVIWTAVAGSTVIRPCPAISSTSERRMPGTWLDTSTGPVPVRAGSSDRMRANFTCWNLASRVTRSRRAPSTPAKAASRWNHSTRSSGPVSRHSRTPSPSRKVTRSSAGSERCATFTARVLSGCRKPQRLHASLHWRCNGHTTLPAAAVRR